MWLCYLDESGTAHLNDDQPFYVVTAVSIEESRWQAMRRDLESVLQRGRKRCLPDIIETCKTDDKKSAKWSRKAFESNREIVWSKATDEERKELQTKIEEYLKAKFELHTEPVWRGSDCYMGVSYKTRMAILDDAIEVLEAHKPQIISVGLDKQKHKKKYPVPYPCAAWTFNLLIERVDGMLKAQGTGQRGILVADSGGADGGQITRLMRILQKGGGTMVIGKTIERVIDNVYFVDSVQSPEVQVADVCGYFLRHHFVGNDKTKQYQDRVLALMATGWQRLGPSHFP